MPRGPLAEMGHFLRAALLTPVPRDHRDPAPVLRRRRVVTALTLVAGTALLWWSLSLRPGDPLFYVGTAALAATWIVGALLSGPLYLGRGHTRTGFLQIDHAEEPGSSGGEAGDQAGRTAYSRPVVQSLALGALLLGIFLVGALVVAQVPALAGPVEDLLDHARYGSLPLVLLITVVNGIA